MRPAEYRKIFLAIALFSLLLLAAFLSFFAQGDPHPMGVVSPTPTPKASPTVSRPTATPAATPLPGAQNFHQWGSVTLFNGMPSDNVHAIAQTPDGVMWFGTDEGLARFDGRTIQTIKLGDAAPGKVLCLKTAPDGALWAGTERGLFRYQNNLVTPVAESAQYSFTAITVEKTILAAATSGNLFRAVESDEGISLELKQTVSGRLSSFAQAGSTTVIGTYGAGGHLIGDAVTGDNSRASVSFEQPSLINVISADANGMFWIGADTTKNGSGLFTLAGEGPPKNIGGDLGNVFAIEPDKHGGTWVGTAKNGLYRFTGTALPEHFTFEKTAGGLRSDTIFALFIDRENVLWIGTNHGVCRYDPSSPFIQTVSDNVNSNFVRTLYRNRSGRILAGTNRGLFSFGEGKWIPQTNAPAKAIYAITETADGSLLFGGTGGVTTEAGGQIAEGDTRAFARFGGKTYAAIFETGLRAIGESSAPLFSGSTPTALLSTEQKLWIGTSDGGMFSFDGQTAGPEPAFAELRGAAIRKITPGENGTMWVASSRGIYRFENGELHTIVAGYDVRDLIADGADAWAATVNGGLLHLGRDQLFGWLVSDLNVEQGMPSQQVFAILKSNNQLLIGTNRGVVNYTPSPVRPQVVFSRILSRRVHQPNEWNETISLDYPENSLLIEAAGQSSRTFPEQFQYAFILRNSKGEIIGKRLDHDARFSPSNLGPGEYTVEARAFNKDLLFSDPITVKFAVSRSPFPWSAAALGVLLFIAVIALVWAMVERKNIAIRNRELAAARFDLAHEAERERSRIARDLHDQTLADLRNLMMMSDRLQPANPEFRSEIESVSTEIRRICEDLSPSVLENVGLVPALEFLLTRLVKNHKFTTSEDANDLVKFPVIVQLQIYRIAQEVLTNIVHHSDATRVEMNVDVLENEAFRLIIHDNGSAFRPSSNAHKGRGISNIKSRANIINARINWKTEKENGNTFSLEIEGKSD